MVGLLPVVANAKALRYAMFIIKDLRLQQVIFEGDCQQVLKDVNSLQDLAIIQSSIISDTKNLMSQNPSWTVQFVHWEAKMAAHGESVWMEDCLTNVISVVMKDMECNPLYWWMKVIWISKKKSY